MEGFLNSCTKQKREGSITSPRTSPLVTWATGPITVGYNCTMIDNVQIAQLDKKKLKIVSSKSVETIATFRAVSAEAGKTPQNLPLTLEMYYVFKVNFSNIDVF